MTMEMPGQTWAAFLGMWTVMTAAMMLPSLVPMLVRFRRDLVGASGARASFLVLIVALAYFAAWLAVGVLVFPFSTLVERLHPLGSGVIVVVAIAYQFTPWKALDLACCRHFLMHARPRAADARTALREGVHYWMHCARCCANLMVIPFVLGTMSVGVMVVVSAVITWERLAPRTTSSARPSVLAPFRRRPTRHSRQGESARR